MFFWEFPTYCHCSEIWFVGLYLQCIKRIERTGFMSNLHGLIFYWFLTHPLFLKYFFNVYLFLRQRETSMNGGGAEREGDTESEAAPGSELSAQSPMQARTHRPRDHDPSRSRKLNQLSHPGAPISHSFLTSTKAHISVLHRRYWTSVFIYRQLLFREIAAQKRGHWKKSPKLNSWNL